MSATIAPFTDIMTLTNKVWFGMGLEIFESAWIVCGYFQPEFFGQFRATNIPSMEVAREKLVINPAGILNGSGLQPTPQFCTRFQWQMKDRFYVSSLGWIGDIRRENRHGFLILAI